MPPEGDDHGLFLRRKHRRFRLLRPGGKIGDRRPLLPLGDRLLVHAIGLRQRPQALLTMLYRSTDRLCRGGAPVSNLAHSASFHSGEKNAPSKSGIKHLAHYLAIKMPCGVAKDWQHQGQPEKQRHR